MHDMYQIREITLSNEQMEKKSLIIEFDDSRMNIVGEFLMTDASLVNFSVLDNIEKVLSGELSQSESSGNRCFLAINKEKTVLSDLFEGMFDGFDTLPSREIETKLLRDLIIMWKDKLASFREKNH